MHEPPAEFPANAVHLLRTSQTIHVQLSAMADTKASILMSATSIIFTLSLGQLSLGRSHGVSVPLAILAATAFLSALLSILTVMPSSGGRAPGEGNLLFFGSFARLGEEEFVGRLLARLHRDDDIYQLMARDLYQNGLVLARKKYRLLRRAYGVLLAGLAASGVAFLAQLA